MIKHRGKTIALLSSIAISTMIIFCTLVIRDSGYESQIQEAKDLFGYYQVWFENLNYDKVKRLEIDTRIKKISRVKYICEIVNKKSGVKLDLNSYDKDFIKSLNYKLIGKEPIKDGEIVIEKEALNQMGIYNPLNKSIDMLLINEYTDNNGINNIDSKNKKFKIVGLIEKPDRYYKSLSNSISGVKTQAFIYKKSTLNIKNDNTYKGTIFLKRNICTSDFIGDVVKKLNLKFDDFYKNSEVSTAKLLKDSSKNNEENYKKVIILIIVSSLVIYNIFNIILQGIKRQIGIMRAIGMTRKNIKIMFSQLIFIYIVLGTLIGIVIGVLISYFGIRLVYGYSSRLKIENISIISSFIVSIISVTISTFILLRKSSKMSIVELIKSNEKYKRRFKKKFNLSKNIIIDMSIKNVCRNKSRTIITITVLTLVGAMFIFNFTLKEELKKNIEKGITGGIWGMSYGNIDKTVSGSIDGSESLFYKIDKNMINKIKGINGVKEIQPNFFNSSAYIKLSSEKLSKDYKDELKRKSNLYKEIYTNEYPICIRGYSDRMLNDRNSFIKEGKNLLNAKEEKYKKVILVNNTYSGVLHSFEAKVIDKVRVGDILSVKIPVYKDGIKQYKIFNVEVSAIMDKFFASSQDGNVGIDGAQIIFREDDYRELTNQKEYNKVYLIIKQGKLDEVEKKLNKLIEDYSFSSIGGKGEDLKFIGLQQNSEDRLTIIYQCLILFIISINSILIMRSNIIVRKKELSTLRAIGVSLRDIKKSLIIESQFYGVVASIIGAIISIIYQYIGILETNNMLKQGSFKGMIEFNLPWKQIIILFIIFIFIGFISVYISKDKIEGTSIIEGISENE